MTAGRQKGEDAVGMAKQGGLEMCDEEEQEEVGVGRRKEEDVSGVLPFWEIAHVDHFDSATFFE